MAAESRHLRCALYTRKSSDEGLDQEFNSLDAQREACEAYVKSQTHEGWRVIDSCYDDGGFSGGSMERPALRKLLADIAAGKVDVIVVYKIDRLTRSLADFARMVELFDKHEVSFVSVTQSFNTTTSMGRLTLNVLLSFAQFEREVTGERIRDKIAASKAKGMWMGGVLPLGYDLPKDKSRMLVVNEAEAETVRLIYRSYLKLQSVHELERWLISKSIKSKAWTSRNGRKIGGQAFSRGALYHLLRNPVYLGFIRHKDTLHAGGHDPLLDKALFDKVQRMLDAGAARQKEQQAGPTKRAPLTGRIFDANGEPMSPAFSRGARGKPYRYYVSSSLQKGAKAGAHGDVIQRVPAAALEEQLAALIARLIPGKARHALDLPGRVEIHRGAIHITLPKQICRGIQGRLGEEETIAEDLTDDTCLRLAAPLRIRNLRGRTHVETGRGSTARRDPVLINALRKAHRMIGLDTMRLPFLAATPSSTYLRRLARLAFLAPDIQQAILDGTQPADLNLAALIQSGIPIDWSAQRRVLGMNIYR